MAPSQDYGATDKDPLLPHGTNDGTVADTSKNQRLSDVTREFSKRQDVEQGKRKLQRASKKLAATSAMAGNNTGAPNATVFKNVFSYKEKEKEQEKKQKRESMAMQQQHPGQQKQQIHRPSQSYKQRYTWLYILLHPHSRHPHSVIYKAVIFTIIVMDVLCFIASTEDDLAEAYPQIFYIEEGIVSSVFLLEYICRLYVAPQSRKYEHMSPLEARLKDAFTVTSLIDLVAALPFFVELPFDDLDLPNLTWIRVFRLFRILKTKHFARSMETVWRVIYYNGEILYVAMNMCIFLVLITAVLMYYLRPQNPKHAEEFKSLTSTMYLSAMMLTGQGGPSGELPWYTKCVLLVTGVFSVAMFAIPASMLTWGFEAEAERCAKKAQRDYVKSMQERQEEQEEEEINGGHVHQPTYADYISTSSEPSDGDTTDEEYLNIIAGGELEQDDKNGANSAKDELVKQLIETFKTSDTDADGTLNMDEFIGLMTDPSETSQHVTMVGMATSVGFLAQRVQTLEQELKSTHDKLDQILEAVASNKGRKGFF